MAQIGHLFYGGGVHGAISILDRMWEKTGKKIFEPFRWLLTFIIVNVLWLLFRSDSIIQWKNILKRICFFNNTTASEGLMNVFCLPEVTFINSTLPIIGELSELVKGFWMIIFILVSSIICFVPDNNYRAMKRISAVTMLFAAVAFIWSFICLSGESDFVYFNF